MSPAPSTSARLCCLFIVFRSFHCVRGFVLGPYFIMCLLVSILVLQRERERDRERDRQTYHARIQEFSSEIYHFSRFQRGSNIFQGGPTFSGGGGSDCFFPIETNIACDFPGGPDPLPPPPLDPHLQIVAFMICCSVIVFGVSSWRVVAWSVVFGL